MRTRHSDRDHVDDAYAHEDGPHETQQAQPSRRDSGLGAVDARAHDSFAGSSAAVAVTELEAAVAEPAVLAQPTPALAAVLRTATKVRLLPPHPIPATIHRGHIFFLSFSFIKVTCRHVDLQFGSYRLCWPGPTSIMGCCACVDGLAYAYGRIVYTHACRCIVTPVTRADSYAADRVG